MKIPFTNINIGAIQNVSENKPKRSSIIDQISQTQIFQTRKDIQDWNNAVNLANSKTLPDRAKLMDIYRDISIDGHLTGIITSIKNKIKSREFEIVDENDNLDEYFTEKFKQKWFYTFLDYSIDALFYGYSLIELGAVVDDIFESITLVPREYVIPEYNGVKKSLYYTSGQADVVRFDKPPYDRWTVFVRSGENLGIFNKVVPHCIGKKNLLISAWEYAELFGMPLRLVYTDIEDATRRKNAETMLKNMGSAGWGVLDSSDKVDFQGRGDTDATDVFLLPFETHNKEISKAIGGQTGVFDEKAFVGSTEAHERLFDEYCNTYALDISYTVNDLLIPKMLQHNISLEGKRFKWVSIDKLSFKDKIEAIKNLAPFVKFEEGFIAEFTGLKIVEQTEKKEDVNTGKEKNNEDQDEEQTAKMKEINELYNNICGCNHKIE